MSEKDWGPGYLIADRYRLVSKLGQGGMGSVWRADHATLGSPVAIKMIDPSIAGSNEALSRFMREAQAAAQLRSPHVVQVLDYGTHEGVPYIAMELMEGESLADKLHREGRLGIEETARIVSHVCRAMSRAHDAGIVHRDLKPDNIFIVKNDDEIHTKVLDFGIAKTKSGLSATSQTRTGAVLGTPYYMSPEQAEGKRAIDYRSDLWSLSVITYECVVGQRPFESDALGDLVLQICARPLPKPSDHGPVPPGFDEWFAKGTARELDGRFSSARELSDGLRALAGTDRGSRVSALADGREPFPSLTEEEARTAGPMGDTATPVSRTGRHDAARMSPRLVIGATAATVLGVAGLALALFATDAPPTAEAEPGADGTETQASAAGVAEEPSATVSPVVTAAPPEAPEAEPSTAPLEVPSPEPTAPKAARATAATAVRATAATAAQVRAPAPPPAPKPRTQQPKAAPQPASRPKPPPAPAPRPKPPPPPAPPPKPKRTVVDFGF